MAESLAKRVGRIISGGLVAIGDAIDGTAPELVMEGAIKEVDDAIDEARTELGRILAAKHLAGKRLAEKNSRHEELTEKIEIALNNKREDLAEAAVAHQLDIEAQIPILTQTITENTEKEKELSGYVTALLAKKREMRETLDGFRASRATGASGKTQTSEQFRERKVEKSTEAFDRVLAQYGGQKLSAAEQINIDEAKRMQELEALARQNRIKERMAIIKANIEQG